MHVLKKKNENRSNAATHLSTIVCELLLSLYFLDHCLVNEILKILSKYIH